MKGLKTVIVIRDSRSLINFRNRARGNERLRVMSQGYIMYWQTKGSGFFCGRGERMV